MINPVVREVPNHCSNNGTNNTLSRLSKMRRILHRIVQEFHKNAKGWVIPLDSLRGTPKPWNGGNLDVDSLRDSPEPKFENFFDDDKIESGTPETISVQQTSPKILSGSEEKASDSQEEGPTSVESKPLKRKQRIQWNVED